MSLDKINIPVKHPEYILWAILIGLIIFLIVYLIHVKKSNNKKFNEMKERNDRDERFSKVTIEERSKITRRFSDKK